MSEQIVFCTSSSVDRKLLRRLNQESGELEYTSPAEATKDIWRYVAAPKRKLQKRTDMRSDAELDIFEDWTVEQCADFYMQTFEVEKFVEVRMFVILDERSTKDSTLLFNYRAWPDEQWWSWRVEFKDAFFMLVGVTEDIECFHDTFKHADRFLVDDVFPAREAVKQTIAERQQRYREMGRS